jgi:hypothetical protein
MISNFFKIVFVLLFIFNQISGQTQSKGIKKCNCTVLLNPDYTGSINLYQSPNGKSSTEIRHNERDEDYIIFEVKKSTDRYFFVSANYSINGYIADGWIKKSNLLGVYSRKYEENDSLVLYKFPDRNLEANSVIKKYNIEFLKVIDCDYNWVRVQFKIGDKIYSGWIPPEMQCNNPYTTCN